MHLFLKGCHSSRKRIATLVLLLNKPLFLQDKWMDDLRFYALFNSISVVSGQWEGDNEKLCAMEPCLRSQR